MRHTLMVCAAALVIGHGQLGAQAVPALDPAGLQLTRAELEQMLVLYEQSATQATYGEDARRQLREESALIRQRLQDGDLRAGDRIVLRVEGFAELTDTFNVGAARSIVLPEIGEVPLSGVLRSELQPHIATHLARFINNPVVHARALVRLEILGAVGRPGFYTVPSDVFVGDALMMAGGPGTNARLDRITIQRGSEVIWSGERLREAVIEGRTLDQLSIRAGDGIHVPERSSRLANARNIGFLITGIASFVTLMVQVF